MTRDARPAAEARARCTAAGARAQVDRGCPRCGGEVEREEILDRMTIVCPRCGDRYYASDGMPAPVDYDAGAPELF